MIIKIEDERQALDILKKGNYFIDRGIIVTHKPISKELHEESLAIHYLVTEWDFTFMSKGAYEEWKRRSYTVPVKQKPELLSADIGFPLNNKE